MITGKEMVNPIIKTDEAKTNRNIHGPSYGNTYSIGGLTIRQYYAGLAMAANSDNDDMTPEQVAIEAVQYADALINELNKEK